MNSWLTALKLAALVALAFSSLNGVEDYLGAHHFCAPGQGCEQVRASALGQAIGHLLPALGTVVYTTIVLASLSRSSAVRRLVLGLAFAGGVGGGALLGAQAFVLHHFCWLCVGVDAAAVAAGAFALLAWRRGGFEEPGSGPAWVWAAATLWALAVPPIWTLSRPAELPEMVVQAWRDQHLNIVEWSDFNCPHCRDMHPVLTELIEKDPRAVNLVRVNVASSSRHSARAYRCALAQGRGEAMASALFTATKLSERGCAELAAAIGLETQEFHRCVKDPATDAAIETDKQAVRDAGLRGLPTVWIGGRKFVGFDPETSPEHYAAAFAAADTPPSHRPEGWLALLLSTLVLAGVGRALERRVRGRAQIVTERE